MPTSAGGWRRGNSHSAATDDAGNVHALWQHRLGMRDPRRSALGWPACLRVRRGRHAVPVVQRGQRRQSAAATGRLCARRR